MATLIHAAVVAEEVQDNGLVLDLALLEIWSELVIHLAVL